MLDLMFDMICGKDYHTMVLVFKDDSLYAVPCEGTVGGIYPQYDKQVKLSQRKVEGLTGDYGFESDKLLRGIIITLYDDEFEIELVEDSWDGFCFV